MTLLYILECNGKAEFISADIRVQLSLISAVLRHLAPAPSALLWSL